MLSRAGADKDDSCDHLAQVAQLTIFCSLIASLVTQSDPDNQAMDVCLLIMLNLPFLLVFVVEARLQGLQMPHGVGMVGRGCGAIQRSVVNRLDRLLGSTSIEEASRSRKSSLTRSYTRGLASSEWSNSERSVPRGLSRRVTFRRQRTVKASASSAEGDANQEEVTVEGDANHEEVTVAQLQQEQLQRANDVAERAGTSEQAGTSEPRTRGLGEVLEQVSSKAPCG